MKITTICQIRVAKPHSIIFNMCIYLSVNGETWIHILDVFAEQLPIISAATV